MSTLALLGGEKSFAHDLAEFTAHPTIAAEEIAEVVRLLARNEISFSPYVREFEGEFASFVGAKYALAHNNGTSTLHAAYFAVGVGPGDEVLTPAYSWHLQCTPIMAAHGIPVFCDVHPITGAVLPEEIERKITGRTKAIAVLHPFGYPAPMDEIMTIARRHGLPVIEDCSHAHGATYKGKHVGTLGDIGCFSLQASKVIVAGEGGILVTDNRAYYEKAVTLGHYERIAELEDPGYRKYAASEPDISPACFGFKYRIHPLAAAIARAQLRKLPRQAEIFRANMRYLTGKLDGLHPAFTPAPETGEMERVWLNYHCHYDEEIAGVGRDTFLEALCAEGLGVYTGRAWYLPVYWNPLYEEKDLWGKGCPFSCPFYGKEISYPRGLCPNAEQIWQRQVGLPMFWNRTPQEVLDDVAAAVGKVLDNLDALRRYEESR